MAAKPTPTPAAAAAAQADAAAAPNALDRLVAYINPRAGARRAQARQVLAYYEAAKADRLRKNRREAGSGNTAVMRAGSSLRQQARHFEQNYDLALGALNILVGNIVGPRGIGVEPQPRRADGTIHDEFAREILALYKDWCRRPEVTARHDWPSAQRLLCRSWVRDGEVFAQHLIGPVSGLDHGTRVPYSVEMLECDYVPMELYGTQPMVVQGIQINAWGAPVAYRVYKADPTDIIGNVTALGQTKTIPAASMMHLANVHRIRQLRGVSAFATVLNRFDDLKDYEESERIAAKIAASMAAFIKKGTPDQYDTEKDATGTETARQIKFRPGMVFDDLRPGEDIGTIDTNRPNPNLETYRSAQLKAAAAGTGTTGSAISKTYDGTYSAQRQELVEGWIGYAVLASEFASRIVRPVYESFIAAAVASGQLRVPADVVRATLEDAEYIPPQMPWIDPVKEAMGWRMLVRAGFASEPEVIRRRGGNPADTLEQIASWRRRAEERNLVFDSDAAKTSSAGTAQDYLRELADAKTADTTTPQE